MIKVLQTNMNRSKTADDLLTHLKCEGKADLVIINEQYTNKSIPTWYSDTLNTAAIWITNPKIGPVIEHGSADGFVWVYIKDVTYVSCYLTPNEGIQAFQQKLDLLEDMVRRKKRKIMVAGDFNAKAVEWGMPKTDTRGKRIMEMAASLQLLVLNTGRTTTFRRPGCKESILDITFASECLSSCIKNWKVLENYTGSDHQYIYLEVGEKPKANSYQGKRAGWNVSKMDEAKLSDRKSVV